jgi:hypothetical protein
VGTLSITASSVSTVSLGASVFEASAYGFVAALTTATTNLNTYLNGPLQTKLQAIDNQHTTIKTNEQAILTQNSTIGNQMTSALSGVTSLNSAISGITTTGITPNQLTPATQASLLSTLSFIQAYLTAASTASTSISSAVAAQISASNTLDINLNAANVPNIGTNVTSAGKLLYLMQSELTNLKTYLTAGVSTSHIFSGPVTSYGYTLPSSLDAISAATSTEVSTVTTNTMNIFNHVDQILAADCEANLVTVPILTVDSSGFYAAPSLGLQQALQNYLNTIKEVTHTVSVTSGVNSLVPAAITITASILSGYSVQVLTASINAVVAGLLRNRVFGHSLYVSDLVSAILSLKGIYYVNVVINGYRPVGHTEAPHTDLLVNGNLVISKSQVITLSEQDLTVTVTTFVPPTS